jgi:excisionase family DNA binding protein
MPAQHRYGRIGAASHRATRQQSGDAMFSYPSPYDGSSTGSGDDSVTDRPARPRASQSRGANGGTAPLPAEAPGRWLSIDAACKLLGVDQSTLRRWSDSGKIPVFRTPGGHRRYAEDDLKALVRGEPKRKRMSRQVLTTRSMSAYEHDYVGKARGHSWYRAYDTATLDELRPLGRRMVDLTIRYISGRGDRDDILEESRQIGRQYGYSSSRVGLSTAEALEAFLFFRTPVVQAVTSYIEDENVPTARAARITSELNHFMDQVLIATIQAHQAHQARERDT